MLKNVLAAVTGAVLIVLGFMFSLMIRTTIAVGGLAVWGYLNRPSQFRPDEGKITFSMNTLSGSWR